MCLQQRPAGRSMLLHYADRLVQHSAHQYLLSKRITTQNKMENLAVSQQHWRRILMINILGAIFFADTRMDVSQYTGNKCKNTARVNKVTVMVMSTHFCPRDGKGKRVEFICSSSSSNSSSPVLAV